MCLEVNQLGHLCSKRLPLLSPTLSFSGWQKLLVPQGERIQHRGRALCLSLNSDPSEQLGKHFGRSWTMSQPVSNLQKPGYSLLFYTIHHQLIQDQEEILSLGGKYQDNRAGPALEAAGERLGGSQWWQCSCAERCGHLWWCGCGASSDTGEPSYNPC